MKNRIMCAAFLLFMSSGLFSIIPIPDVYAAGTDSRIEESYNYEKLSWFDGRDTHSRNVLPNSGFEVGFSSWQRLNTGIGDNDVFWTIDADAAVSGTKSVRIHHDLDTSISELKSSLVQIEPKGTYTVSAYMKTDNPEISVIICGRYVNLSTDWKRYNISFDNLPPEVWDSWTAAKEGTPRMRSVFFGVCGKGTVWVNAVQLEKGELTDYAAPSAVEIGVGTGKIDDLFAEKEPLMLSVSAFNGTCQPVSPLVRYVVKDFQKYVVAEGKIDFSGLAPGKAAMKELRLPIEGKGVFQALFFAEGIETLPLNVCVSFGRIAVLSNKGTDESDYFGLTNGAVTPNAWLEWSLSEAIGAKYVTTYGIGLYHYYFMEKLTGHKVSNGESRRITYEKINALKDRTRALIKKYGLIELNTLARPGVFWSKPAPEELTPAVIDGWAKALAEEVQREKGTVKYWEIPTETLGENSTAGIYHAKEYIKMLKAGYETIKGIDPSAVVIGGGNNDFGRLADDAEALLKLGGGNYMDAWSIHPYCWSDPEDAGYARELKRLKKVMKKYGFEKDIWITEVGWCGTDRFYKDMPEVERQGLASERTQAEYIVKANVIALTEGVRHFLTFLVGGGMYGLFGNHYNSPKAAVGAYAQMTSMLRDATFTDKINMGGIVTAYRFEKKGHPLIVMWNPDKYEPVTLDIPVGQYSVRITDMMGNPTGKAGRERLKLEVTGSPLYIYGTGISAEALNKAMLQSKVADRDVLDINVDLQRYAKKAGVTITNRSPEKMSGTITFVFPDEWKIKTSQVKYGPLLSGGSEEHSFDLQQVSMFKPYTVNASYGYEGKVMERTIDLVIKDIVARRITDAPRFGQDDDVWKQAPVMEMGKEDVVTTAKGEWKGPEDLSAAIYALWNNEALFLRVVVNEEEFNQPFTEGGIWAGSSLQFLFATDNDRQWKAGNRMDYEYGIALTPKGLQAYRWSGNGGRGLAKEIGLNIERKPGKTIYEIAFPFTSLGGIKPQPGFYFPINMAVNHNNKGEYDKWLQLSPGIVGSFKDVSKARNLLFVD